MVSQEHADAGTEWKVLSGTDFTAAVFFPSQLSTQYKSGSPFGPALAASASFPRCSSPSSLLFIVACRPWPNERHGGGGRRGHPVVNLDGLPGADDFLFGFLARFDSTEPLYRRHLLAGKPTGFFVSTST
ncbi:hypothetical protein GUJ93_ZPchr0010g10523 [Zizania palustris]|uniref:Uncharacterized protein n=1 Tax=Zizania palustris TaxID=103762 RepID=A0A8J5WBS4_ZIZPA|nr:hypothetical protein GUJ93_ZPchr0010g10523 [Zizania palustris]